MRFFRRTFQAFGVLALVISFLTVFEMSGHEPYPAGAREVRIKGTVRDPDYDPTRWHTLSLGEHGRTRLSEWTAWTSTKLQWEGPAQTFVPLWVETGLVKERDVEEGQASVDRARHLAAEWAGLKGEPDFTTARKWTVGPSGGLILTLGFLDAQTPGDLSAGLNVSGSAVIPGESPTGHVNGVDGLPYKLQAARWAHADLVFITYGEKAVREAQGFRVMGAYDLTDLPVGKRQRIVDKPGPLVVQVSSLAMAVDVLHSLGGSCGGCENPVISAEQN